MYDAQNGASAACVLAGVGNDIKKCFRHLEAIGTEGTGYPKP